MVTVAIDILVATLESFYNSIGKKKCKISLIFVVVVDSLALDVFVCELYAFVLKLCGIFVLIFFEPTLRSIPGLAVALRVPFLSQSTLHFAQCTISNER